MIWLAASRSLPKPGESARESPTTPNEAITAPTRADLEEVFRLKTGDPATWGWSPRLRFWLGYFTPDEYYPAVEHLGVIAGRKSGGTAAERTTWVKRQRRRLLKGQTEAVLQEITVVCGRRCGPVLKRERAYFQRNIRAGRMNYHRLASAKWPIGSGAIESAIRRVINLRRKGAGIFWHRTSAEAVWLLRAYYKAGRWKKLENQVVTSILEDAA